jgi:hypothetical protein
VLHVATLRQHAAVVRSLIGSGFPVMKQNPRGWMALDEAVSLKDSELVSLGAVDTTHVQWAALLASFISSR